MIGEGKTEAEEKTKTFPKQIEEAIKIAWELGYPRSVLDDLSEAKTPNEIGRILKGARQKY